MADPACAGGSPEPAEGAPGGGPTRKEKRKARKNLKRKQIRRETAIREREAEESRSNDLEEQLRIRLREEEEAVSAERERKAFEERERLWLEAAAARKAEEEAAAAARKAEEESKREKNKQIQEESELEEGDEWEYTEEGPAEIIWQGNEIIVKKKRVRVAKRNTDQKPNKEDDDRPTSNPLPPQSTAFVSYKNGESAQEVLEGVAKQIPNFGTEQDKAHCPFHLKTAACRFGSRCSRVHFYPDKSCTLLIRNMYNGPGLAWEQDEGLEKFISWNTQMEAQSFCLWDEDGDYYCASHTDEEIERCYEEFYEDVHTEFLKFGELVNFKVCKNGSYHLRGNVYVHYKSLESAILAYNAINGRFFAGKQIACEFVGLTRWKVAICGEYMKSRLRTCSHGSACNFIHCFRNPGGDYEWADWDNPPPKYWLKKMYVLFGPSVESVYDKQLNLEEPERLRDSSRKSTPTNYRRQSRRSTHDEMDMHNSGSGGEDSCGRRDRHSTSLRREHSSKRRERRAHLDKHEHYEENRNSGDHGHNVKYYSIGNGHDSGEDTSTEQDRYLLWKRRRCEEKNIFEKHKRKHDTEEDLPSRKKGEAFFGEQGKSEKKRSRKSHERHGKEHRSSDWNSDDTGDNGERSNKNSSRYYDGTQDIDAQERYDGRYCSDDLDSDKDSCQNTSHHSRCPNERREFDRYKSRHHRDHVSHDYEWDGKEAKSRKWESADRRFSSDESGDGWKPTGSDPFCEETHHLPGQSFEEHRRSSRKGKHRRRREHNDAKDQSSNSDSDKLESDRRYKKHSGSRTPVSCSVNPRNQSRQKS